MRIPSAAGIAWLLLALACGCGSKSEDNTGSASGEAKKGSPAIGTFTCKSLKDSACIDATDNFEATAEKVYMIYTTKDLPKKGDVFLSKWIAEDVGEAAPANTVVATHESKVDEIQTRMVSYTVEGELKQPTKGWPKGSYRVEVLLNEKVVTSAKFKIE